MMRRSVKYWAGVAGSPPLAVTAGPCGSSSRSRCSWVASALLSPSGGSAGVTLGAAEKVAAGAQPVASGGAASGVRVRLALPAQVAQAGGRVAVGDSRTTVASCGSVQE
jgi:hypothetical protein